MAAARNNFFLLILASVALSYIVEAPIRYLLVRLGLPMATLVLRDVISLTAVAAAGLAWTRGDGRYLPLIIACYVLGLHCAVGFFELPKKIQVLVGLKVYLPMLLGLVSIVRLEREESLTARFALVTLLLTGAGVLANIRISYPWTGLAYDSALGVSADLQRDWTQQGVARLGGFARVSFDAAMFCLVLLVPVLASGWSVTLKLAMFAWSGVVIWFTTTKGALLGLLALAGWLLLRRVPRLRPLTPAYVAGAAMFCVAFPFIAVVWRPSYHSLPGGRTLSSLVDRIVVTWPQAIGTLDRYGNYLTGRGVGSIGYPQIAYEWRLYNPGDNLAIYLFASFGVIFLGYLSILLFRYARTFSAGRVSRFWLDCTSGWLVVLFSYGVTANMLEEPVMCMALGLGLGTIFVLGRDDRARVSS